MKAFKQFLSWIVSILFLISGIFLTYLGVGGQTTGKKLLKDFGSQSHYTVLIIFGLLIILIAVLYITYFLGTGADKGQYLLKSESGNILITRQSLESTIKSAIMSLDMADVSSCKAAIEKDNKIYARVECDVFKDTDYQEVGKKIQDVSEKALYELTGLEDSQIEVSLNKAKRAEKVEELK